MKKSVIGIAALGLVAMSIPAQALVAPGRVICGNQTNLFSIDFGNGSNAAPLGPFTLKDVDGSIAGAVPLQGVSWEIFAHTMPNGDPTTEEQLGTILLDGYGIADQNGRLSVSVHLTSNGAMVNSQDVACIHVVAVAPVIPNQTFSVKLTVNVDQ